MFSALYTRSYPANRHHALITLFKRPFEAPSLPSANSGNSPHAINTSRVASLGINFHV